MPGENGVAQVPAGLIPPQLMMRAYWRGLGTQAATIGGRALQFDALREGYLAGFLVLVETQYDIATADPGFEPRSPYTFVSNFQVRPPGAQTPINVDGWHAWVSGLATRDFGQLPSIIGQNTQTAFVNGIDRSTLADLVFPSGVATNQVGRLWYFLPAHRSRYDIRGILPMGNQTTTSLFVRPAGSLADLFTTEANVTIDSFDVTVFQLIYSPPPPDRVWHPQLNPNGDIAPVDTSWVFTLEEQVMTPVLGANEIRIDPGQTILGIYHTLLLNDAQNDAGIETLELRFDQTFYMLREDPMVQWIEQRALLGTAHPRGVVIYDFDRFVDADGAAPAVLGAPAALSMGEWVPTDRVSTILSRITIAAGATLGATPRIHTCVKRLQRLVG